MNKDFLFFLRNFITKFFYRYFAKPIFFMQDPEKVHDKMILFARFLGSNIITKFIVSFFFNYSNSKYLSQNILGIKFRNPIGLAAGFDKNAQIIPLMGYCGFGFTEIGSVTGSVCKGNLGKRLWRLKKSNSLRVYYGLKNNGCLEISKRLSSQKFNLPVGVSIAKTNSKNCIGDEIEIEDYLKSYIAFQKVNVADYFTINISCPNAFGGQPFTDVKKLSKLFLEISKLKKTKPIFIKMSHDLTKKQLDEIILCSRKSKIIDGFICSNLTKTENSKIVDKVEGKGGFSGKVVFDLSLEMVKYVYTKTKGDFIIIGCGGIFNGEDAYKYIKSGASLLQLVTGMIYQGPQVISQINLELSRLLKQDGFSNISQAIGKDIKL